MQTFLPLPDFAASARVLDTRRLGKQRIEAWQILATLSGASSGWANHPAVRMWRATPYALALYGTVICDEWRARGHEDAMRPRFDAILATHFAAGGFCLPRWFGDDAFHAAHRCNLLRKDAAWYGQFGWGEPPDLPYFWPEP
jgi:hypothetical protein